MIKKNGNIFNEISQHLNYFASNIHANINQSLETTM